MRNVLNAWLNPEQRDGTIFDIVLYGSVVKGKRAPRDIDIAVIFRSGTLKERLAKLQEMKKRMPEEMHVDMKAILLEELFQERFLARSGIFLEGVSLFDDRTLAEKIGFRGMTVFIYSLQNKTHTEKIKLTYLLSGRGGEGILTQLGGKRLARGVAEIPIPHSLEFAEILDTQGVTYSKMNILVQR